METVRELCVIAVFCAVLPELIPEGGVRKIMSVLCSAVLILVSLGGVKQLDYDVYAREMSRLREEQAAIELDGEAMRERMNRLVIAQELETYILDKARELEVPVTHAQFSLRWSSEGFWVPESVELTVSGRTESEEDLRRILEAELGIPSGGQIWKYDE